MDKQNKQQGIVEKWNEIYKMDDEISTKKRKIMDETEEMAKEKRRMMDEILNRMIEKDEEIGKLKKENRALKLKVEKMESDLKAQNVSIRRKMAAELVNELFASTPLENAFGLLTKMPNGLFAKNVRKMFNGIKEIMKNNKLNEVDCGPKLVISKDGLAVKHSGPNERNCIRAVLPIPSLNMNAINKPIITSYFEMEILNGDGIVLIGFCDHQFPLLEGGWLGFENNSNSIGICSNRGIRIDGTWIEFRDDGGFIKKDDFVGIGIIHQPNSKFECFATLNGKFLGKATLLPKFANIELFPAISLYNADNSVLLNFGKEEWHFKEFGRVLQ